MDIDSGTKFEQPTARVARREERRETNWIALIRLPDGTEIPTTVKDISPSPRSKPGMLGSSGCAARDIP
jgi:hypothetical protein